MSEKASHAPLRYLMSDAKDGGRISFNGENRQREPIGCPNLHYARDIFATILGTSFLGMRNLSLNGLPRNRLRSALQSTRPDLP